MRRGFVGGTDRRSAFEDGFSTSSKAGKALRLRLRIRSAKLYLAALSKL
ncbi:MAG: hypothetical protein IKR85_02655 [Clostridia bacterium]|nr:hypothetical protein [Clostridia bacterium]